MKPISLPLWVALAAAFASSTLGQEAGPSDLAELNRALSSGDQPVKIVCFGDSVTGVYYHTGGQRAYTDMLGIALKQIHPKANVTTINAGISGHTTANALARIEKDVISHQPDLVTVMFGLNDVAKLPIEDYRKNLIEIVRKCRSAGAEVILCTPNAVVTTEARPVEKLVAYCDVVREVANEHEVPLCDSYAEFEAMGKRDREAWLMTLSGEIHPNMAGHKAIAEQIARTITGQATSLADVGPPPVSLSKTRGLLKEKKAIKILAMPPFDKLVAEALKSIEPEANLEVSSWPIEGLNRYLIRKDASHRVRQMKPDLVLVAIPRSAESESREQFIHDQMWAVNYAQSFGKKEWDVVVIHPSVAEPNADPSEKENDDLIRTITAAQDLSLIDRAPGDNRSAAAILSEWIKEAMAPPPGLGMWSWQQAAFASVDARRSLLEFCEREGISHIDQHVSLKKEGENWAVQNAESLVRLVIEARERGITVNALRGDPAMFFATKQSATLDQLAALIRFDRQLPQNSRLAGIKFDVEPYLTPEWKKGGESRQQVMRDYLNFLNQAKATLKADAPHLELAADVPFWWDKADLALSFGGIEQGLVHHVQDLTDWMGIMSYRRSSEEALRLVSEEIAHAEETGRLRSVSPAIEGTPVKGKESHITFHGLPPESFRKALEELRESLTGNPAVRSVMLHDYKYLVEYLSANQSGT